MDKNSNQKQQENPCFLQEDRKQKSSRQNHRTNISIRFNVIDTFKTLKRNKHSSLNSSSMSLQYISDNDGKTTGVFIPIQVWKELKEKYNVTEGEYTDIPEWQIKETQRRLDLVKKGEISTRNWDEAQKDIFRK